MISNQKIASEQCNFVFCGTMLGLKKEAPRDFNVQHHLSCSSAAFFACYSLSPFALDLANQKFCVYVETHRALAWRPRPLSFFCHSSLTLKKALVRALVRITCAQRKFSLTCFIDASCLLIWFSSIIGLPGQVSPGSSLWVKEEKMVPL